ncbi:uncharacterized protein RSE6_09481 [Rhynchosporium secalis]|uniref:Uncharacterized protein n=1 Tax=Rhynchosporium secalis TaxID=38038 RepID=A0A1E1MI43_RHYSE|nr:uncharacterized protein RSE6_09481 [Rhynchosporium secalis]
MFAKSLLLASFAVMALADPIPAPQISPEDLSSLLDDATSALDLFSGLPTLPASIQDILATAVPESELTKTDLQCIATATPSWYSDLPNNAKSAISSYETAIASWYSENSSNLSLGTNVPAPCPAPTAGGSSPTTTASKKGASTTSSSRTGSVSPSSSVSTGAVSTTGSSTAAATRATAMIASIAGLAGILGVMAAL